MDFLVNVLVNAAAFFLGAQLLSGVRIQKFTQAIIVALVIALLNITLGIVLKVITLGILSLGIFTLLLDAILILVADYFLKDFSVKNFWWALLLAMIVAFLGSIFNAIF